MAFMSICGNFLHYQKCILMRQYLWFLYMKLYFLFLIMTMCEFLCVGIYAKVKKPTEVRVVRPPGAGVTRSCEPPDEYSRT